MRSLSDLSVCLRDLQKIYNFRMRADNFVLKRIHVVFITIYLTYLTQRYFSSAAFVGKNGRRWRHEPYNDGSPPIMDFDSSSVGPAPHCRDMKTPKDVFLAFMSAEIIDEIVECTNLYGSRRYGQDWKAVTKNEILSFVAVLIAAGRNHQNDVSVNDMWTSNGCWRVAFYHIALGKNRFKQIFVCLRTDDVLTRKDRLRKLAIS